MNKRHSPKTQAVTKRPCGKETFIKKTVSIILCLLLIASLVSCSWLSNEENPNAQTSQNPIHPSDEKTPFQEPISYEDILETYKELLLCRKNGTEFPEISDTAPETIKKVYELAQASSTPLDMGYAKKDMNRDGSEELILTESTFAIVAIFTIKDGNAVSLITREDANCSIWLDETGFIRMEQLVMEDTQMVGRSYAVYEISEGELIPRVAIGCDAMKNGNWHKLEGKQQVSVTAEKWNTLYTQYDVCPLGWDVREYTKHHAEVTFVPLLEAAAPKAQTYKLASIIKDDRVQIASVTEEGVSFTMICSKHVDSTMSYVTELSATAVLTDGRYLFDNETATGSIEFGYDSVWVTITESANENLDCRSYLFDFVTSD